MTTETSTTIKVRQYRPEDHAQVTKIYVEGLMAADPNPEYRYLWEELLRIRVSLSMGGAPSQGPDE
ncbi:hypothetical protein F441_20641 [Phytophthora nicotianae CJ01A1]|uniref:Uncharacterized protein n=2 Tax=Phytophthora nicotianae TaxID=4792 RepID=W2VVF4_PHYNI|nr:hypothetical protein F444_20777 [Phytophthora nicotianae P1976]ETP02270.1 hypothetical protein F441_20641 [Phytophthora nicotianae CJ01A1]